MSDLQFCVNLWLSAAKMRFDKRPETTWHYPHVTMGDSGPISLEWWHKSRALVVTFEEIDNNFKISCLRVWGVNIESQMSEKDIDSLDDFEQEWAWLLTV